VASGDDDRAVLAPGDNDGGEEDEGRSDENDDDEDKFSV